MEILAGILKAARARAKQRKLSLDDYVRWCVESDLARDFVPLHRANVRWPSDWWERLKTVSEGEPSRFLRKLIHDQLTFAGYDLSPHIELRTFDDGKGQTSKRKPTADGHVIELRYPADWHEALLDLVGRGNVSLTIKMWCQPHIDTDKNNPLTELRTRGGRSV